MNGRNEAIAGMILVPYGIVGAFFGEFASLMMFFGDGVSLMNVIYWGALGQFVAGYYAVLWPFYIGDYF